MLLHLCTWQEVDAYLRRSTGIIIPIGSTEQHGPNGLIGTDAICPEVIAHAAGDPGEILVAPTINVGVAQHHLGFAGTISLRPSTLIAVIKDTVDSLVRHGFDHCYFLNGHGGNISTINAAFSETYADESYAPKSATPTDPVEGSNRGTGAQFRCKLSNWFMAPGARRLSQQLFGASEGSHATPSEVSLTYYAYPDAIKSVEMRPKIAPTGPILDAEDYRRRFPDGRIGSDPSLATVEAGRQLYEATVADVTRDYREFLDVAV